MASVSLDAAQQAQVVELANNTAVAVAGDKAWAAKRQLKLWGLADSTDRDTLVRLYVSIRDVAGPNAKISKVMLEGFKPKLERVTSLVRKMWIVPSENVVDPKYDSFKVDHHSIQEFPVSIDPDGVKVYDGAVPQIDLGIGVMELQCALHNKQTLKGRQPEVQPAGRAIEIEATGETPPPPAPKSAARKLLKRESETPDEVGAERMAKDTHNSFLKGALVSKDPNDTTVAVFWVRQMTRFTLGLQKSWKGPPEEFAASLDEYVSQYFRFVCTKLLDVVKVDDAQVIAKAFSEILQKLPDLLSPLGQVLVEFLTAEHKGQKTDWSLKVGDQCSWRRG
jgi:hypothetical protein